MTALTFLYLVLAAAVIFITVYLCILMNQATKVLQNAESITQRIDHITEAVESVTSNGVMPILTGVGTLLSKMAGYFGNLISSDDDKKPGRK